ncbi:hypothetical protein PHMEG_0006081, partial [Phytophthora megakarya]
MSDTEDISSYRTTIHWKGYQLTKCYDSDVKTTYRCSYYRGRKGGPGCTAKLDVMANGSVKEKRFPHTCGATPRPVPAASTPAGAEIIEISDDSSENPATPPSVPEDMSHQMANETDALAIQYISSAPSQIWNMIREEFTGGAIIRGLTRGQVINRVYRARNRHFGGSIYGQVEVPPLSLTRDGTNFFRFNFTYATLIRLLTYDNVFLFVDGTFSCVPASFYQCVVIMVYDRASRCFVPAVHILSTSKTEWSWWHCFHCVQVTTGMAMQPGTITCDYERAVINAVRDQFPESTIVGCLFHFKQAIRRRMQKLSIPAAEISTAMGRGVLDLLTVLPHEQIDPRGIEHVTDRIKDLTAEREIEYSERKWAAFCVYFRRTWIEMIPPKLWNVRGIARRLINRTNNLLERYNRELDNAFTAARPNIPTFVGVLERIAHHYVTLLDDITHSRARPPPHGDYFVPPEFTL